MVALVPSHPPSAERAEALAVLGQGLALCWRFERLTCHLRAGTGDGACRRRPGIEIRAPSTCSAETSPTSAAPRRGSRSSRQARDLAEATESPGDLLVAYVSLTDVLMMLGRPGESVEVGRRGLEVVRRFGSDATVLIANIIEALIASGEWDDADRLSAAAVRSITANYPYMLLMNRAELELGRGDFASAKAHLDAALPSLREDRGLGIYDVYLAELALWERRWVDADAGTWMRPDPGQLAARRPAPSLVQRQGAACRGRARRPRPGPPRRRRRRRLARQSGSARHDRPQRRCHGVIDHTQRRRLAGPCRSRVRPRPRPWRAGHVVRRGQHLGTPRTPGAWRPTAAGARPRRSSCRGTPGRGHVPLREAYTLAARAAPNR